MSRIQLVDRVIQGFNCKLTLISAPAGFGKTTLLADCIEKYIQPVGWISLDERDNDKVRFLKYFITALRQIEKGICENSLLALQSPQPLETEILVTGLINEIAEIDRPFIIVLDDYHAITDNEIQQILLFLLDRQPPKMHLIISTRSDPPWPLARFRARGEIEEIRAQEMRFTLEEVSTFLNDIWELELLPEDIKALEKRTEGWVAGLQMAAISLREHKDKNDYIQSFSGSHRFVLDYLMEEVLNQIPDTVKDFLLKTSILDRFNSSLCDYIVGTENSRSMLIDLEQKNLFLIPLDSHRDWYRYHHLFRDLLRSQLNQEMVGFPTQLHKRASEWFEAHGSIDSAVEHATASGDFDFAADVVERNVIAVKDTGDLPVLLKWLQKFPDEIVFSRSWLCIAKAWVLIYLGQAEETGMILNRAEQSLKADEGENIKGHIAAIRCYHYLFRGDLPRSIEEGYKALKLVRETDIATRISAATTLASALRLNGDLGSARQILTEAISLSKKIDHQQTTVRLLCGLSALLIFQGQLANAYTTLQEAIKIGQWRDRDGQVQPMPVTGHAYLRLAQVLKDMNKLEDALKYVELGIKLCRQWGQANALWEGHLVLADIQRARWNWQESQNAFLEAEKVSEKISGNYTEEITNALKAQFWLDTGRIDAAIRWAAHNDLRSDQKVQFREFGQYDIFVNVLIAQKKYQEAQALLSQMVEVAETSGALRYLLSYQVRLSILLEQQGADEQAIKTLIQALELGESSGYLRVFVEQGEHLLGLLRKVSSKGVLIGFSAMLIRTIEDDLATYERRMPASNVGFLIEPLSEREIEVFHYLSSDMTVPEISSHLHISVSTLRTHIRNIYQKLGVHSRFEATTKGGDLGLN